jgi:hypothetical protein
MALLHSVYPLLRPIHPRFMLGIIFLTHVAILAGLMGLLANWIQSTALPLTHPPPTHPQPTLTNFYYEKCNITFAPAHISTYPLSFPPLLVPQGHLDWKDHSCLIQSALNVLIYHISCLLLAGALLIVFSVFLVLLMFLMDLLYFFWRGLVDAEIHADFKE